MLDFLVWLRWNGCSCLCQNCLESCTNQLYQKGLRQVLTPVSTYTVEVLIRSLSCSDVADCVRSNKESSNLLGPFASVLLIPTLTHPPDFLSHVAAFRINYGRLERVLYQTRNIDLEDFVLKVDARREVASTLDMGDSQSLAPFAGAGLLKKQTKLESADPQCDGVRCSLCLLHIWSFAYRGRQSRLAVSLRA